MIHIDLLYDTRTYACTMLNTVYLGAYNEEDAAARAYDLAALKYWGPTTYTNFPVRRILVWCGSEFTKLRYVQKIHNKKKSAVGKL